MKGLKKTTVAAIMEFAKGGTNENMQGSKLAALYRLIQRRGSVIETTDDKSLEGVKALEFTQGEYIAIKHRPVYKDSFFPCMMHQVHLVAL